MPSPAPAPPDRIRSRALCPRPAPSEIAESYREYVASVPEGDVFATLEKSLQETLDLVRSFGEERGDHRYAPGKWSVKEVIGHLADGESILSYRALCIARGDATPLPGYEENDYVARGGFDRRTLADIASEFALVRASSIALFRSIDAEAWELKGTANGVPFLARAFPWVVAGHELHHRIVLRERYL